MPIDRGVARGHQAHEQGVDFGSWQTPHRISAPMLWWHKRVSGDRNVGNIFLSSRLLNGGENHAADHAEAVASRKTNLNVQAVAEIVVIEILATRRVASLASTRCLLDKLKSGE